MPLPMTRPNRHRIQRQIVELAIGDSARGSGRAPGIGPPVLGSCRAGAGAECSIRVAGPDELLRLDRLELDLGQIDGADWPVEFRRKLIAELTRSLAQFTAVSKARDSDAPRDPRRTEPWQEFLFFLSHGHLPWWGARPSDGWTDALPDRLDAAGWSALREAVRADPRARVRLVQSVGDEFLDTAIGRWAGVPHAARVLEHWTPTSLRADARQRWRRAFWMLRARLGVRRRISLAPRRPAARARSADAAPHVCPGERAAASRCRRRRVMAASTQTRSVQRKTSDLPESVARVVCHRSTRCRSIVPCRRRTRMQERRRAARRAESPSRAGSSGRGRRPAEDEAIYLDGAGAILLHPFLEQLFRERGLLAGRELSRHRGARPGRAPDRPAHLRPRRRA